jgi:hypothetical protein
MSRQPWFWRGIRTWRGTNGLWGYPNRFKALLVRNDS